MVLFLSGGSLTAPAVFSTIPAATPAFCSRVNTSSGERLIVHSPTILLSSSSFFFLFSRVPNRGSLARPGCPISRQKFVHSSSVDTTIVHHLSSPWQGYTPCGAA